MEYNFKFSLTEAEFADYNVYTAWTAPWQKSIRVKFFLRIFFLGGIFMAAFFIVMNKVDPPEQDSFFKQDNILMVAIIGFVFNLLATLFSYHRVSYKTRNKAIKFVQ